MTDETNNVVPISKNKGGRPKGPTNRPLTEKELAARRKGMAKNGHAPASGMPAMGQFYPGPAHGPVDLTGGGGHHTRENIENKNTKVEQAKARVFHLALNAESEAIQLAASAKYVEMEEGKPVQKVINANIGGDDAREIVAAHLLTPDQREFLKITMQDAIDRAAEE